MLGERGKVERHEEFGWSHATSSAAVSINLVLFASHQIGAAVAAVGAGAIRDARGSYDMAWFFAGGLCVIAALLSLAITPTRDTLGPETRS